MKSSLVREITVASELNTTAKPHKKKINWKGVVQIQTYAKNIKKDFTLILLFNSILPYSFLYQSK